MLLGPRPWSLHESTYRGGGACKRVGSVTQQLRVGRGPLAVGAQGSERGSQEAGSRPCTWAGGLGIGWELLQGS